LLACLFLFVLVCLFVCFCLFVFQKFIYGSSSNGYRNSQRIRISNLALCNREPVPKTGSLE
jgi:hypothetical protein